MIHKATGLTVREGTDDSRAYGEVKDYYLLDVKDKVVVDIGAHVGFSVNYFLEQGAKGIYAFEADPETFKILEENFRDNPKVILFNEAVTGYGSSSITFYRKKNTRDGTIHAPKNSGVGVTELTVPARNFKDILLALSPNVLKIDCEGAEHTFAFQNLPTSVDSIAMELHIGRTVWKTNSEHICKVLGAQKFTALKEPVFTDLFATVGVWKRESI